MLKAQELNLPNFTLTRERRFRAPTERLNQNPPVSYFEKPNLKTNPEVFLEQLLTKQSNKKIIEDAKEELTKLRKFVESDTKNVDELRNVTTAVDRSTIELNRVRQELTTQIRPTILDINAKLETIPERMALAQVISRPSQQPESLEEQLIRSYRQPVQQARPRSTSSASSRASSRASSTSSSGQSFGSDLASDVRALQESQFASEKKTLEANVLKRIQKEQQLEAVKKLVEGETLKKQQLEKQFNISLKKGEASKIQTFMRAGATIQNAIDEVIRQRSAASGGAAAEATQVERAKLSKKELKKLNLDI